MSVAPLQRLAFDLMAYMILGLSAKALPPATLEKSYMPV
jgi:hypothetical protein